MSTVELPSTGSEAKILVVDDDPMLAALIVEWVDEKWTAVEAHGGEEALELVNGELDMLLLDREMPDLSGDEVLRRVNESKPELQVMMISGLQPDFDILGLPFDDYLEKPIDRPTLQEAIESLFIRRTYEPTIQQFFAAVRKIDLLEATKSPSELAEDERYINLKAIADKFRQEADATLGRLTDHVRDMYDTQADD